MKRIVLAALGLLAMATVPGSARAEFDWKKHKDETLHVLLNNLSWTPAMLKLKQDFTDATGIKLQVETFSEEQYRARLSTILQAKSSDIDVFMTLPSREGQLYARNGWYVDLKPMMAAASAPDFDYDDFSKSLRDSGVEGEHIVSIPFNVEEPLFYWRKDVFEKCGVKKPEVLEDLPTAAEKIKACDSQIIPWAARGLGGTVGYPLGGFIYNMGGDFKTPDNKASLCLPGTIKGIDLYGRMLREFGPPGATNHTFTQVIELLGQGRVAMSNESSAEFPTMMKFPNREKDIGVGVLPKGGETGISKPIVINWSLAISPYSTRQEAAWYFIQWATGKRTQSALAATGIAPSRKSVFDGKAFADWASASETRKEWVKALAQIGDTGTSVYLTPTVRAPEAREILSSVVQQVVLGQADAKTAACAVTDQLQALQK